MNKGEIDTIIWQVDGYPLEITHPNKLYWAKEKISKIDLLNYYKSVVSVMLPYFINRPLTAHYYPRGIAGFSFYKRNFEKNKQPFIATYSYKEISNNKTIQVPTIKSEIALLWLASKGVIEFHLWASKTTNFSNPDMVIFDLDCSEKTPFEDVLQVALHLKTYLKSMNLQSYPKTTGGTGLHIYVPIKPIYSYKFIRDWVKFIGENLALKYPKLITVEKIRGATHLNSKVTIDYLQNVISRNTVAPYSVRAYKNAPVSTPLTWSEIEKGGFLPMDFNLKNTPQRIDKIGDVFAEVLTNQQNLPNY